MFKHFHILHWMPLLYAVLFVSIWIKVYMNESVAFEEFVIEKQCNYAADSAMDAMLYGSNMGLDYIDDYRISLNPEVGKDDFIETMCMNFGYIVNDTTKTKVATENMRSIVIACYDGVYCYTQLNEDNKGTRTLVQSPKIPYLYSDTNNNQYTLTLDPEVGYADSGTPSNNYRLHELGKYSEMGDNVVAPTPDVQGTVIGNTVSEILNWSLYESLSKGKDVTVELPAIAGDITGEQQIDKPTIIGVIEGPRKVFTTPVVAGGIGGAQITMNTDIIGCDLSNYVLRDLENPAIEHKYTGRFYATAEWWEDHDDNGNSSRRTNERYFDSVFEAAKAGYNNLSLNP